ncbi:UDP-glucuronosyltransferase 2B31-like isoform X1 [Amphiura filiformis]|uniref:UDP-glucuronosyltransferase 2B31-like isoform X1 n=1 Tax=Amphiura filiformis TaxID=82378 RepID=UPI003B21A0DA
MATKLLAVLLSVCLFSMVSCSNILLVPLFGEGSHYHVMLKLGRELMDRGHNITMLVADRHEPLITSSKNHTGWAIKYIFHPSVVKLADYRDIMASMTAAGLQGRYVQWILELSRRENNFMQKQYDECHDLLLNQDILSTLRDSNFEISVADVNGNCPIFQYLRQHMGIPYISLSAVLTIPSISMLNTRTPANPAYMPEITSGLDHVMSFSERSINFAACIFYLVVFNIIIDPAKELRVQHELDSSIFCEDAELMLINTNFALDFPRPLLPNTRTVGGLTSGPASPLASEWIEFLESAGEDGVVLFSMGTYANGIDEDVAGLFAGAFAQLPQKVIWKLNGKPAATLTPNVKVADWIPQNDLLGHPQIKAFVYHCGMNGVWEAVYHGVPMVAVPLFGDQYDNAQRLVSRGMAVKVDISTLTSDELAQAIRTIISDPSYKKNATRISAIFRDSPRTPLEVAADWIEYVIRHGGAKHLRSAALDLNIFQYLLLDVIAVLLLAFVTFMIVLYCSCRLCYRGCRRLCSGSSKVKSE